MAKVHIPASIDEAVTDLSGLDGLMKAKQWERAAIVYAFTRDGVPGEGGPGRKQETTSSLLLVPAFADLGIAGLRTRGMVHLHRKAWQAAIKVGAAVHIKPGDDVVLPDLDWQETIENLPGHLGEHARRDWSDEARARRYIADHPEVAVEAAKAIPAVAAAVTSAVVDDPDLSDLAERTRTARMIGQPTGAVPVHHPKVAAPDPGRDHNDRLARACDVLTDELEAEEDGEFVVNAATEAMIAIAMTALADRRRRIEGLPVEDDAPLRLVKGA